MCVFTLRDSGFSIVCLCISVRCGPDIDLAGYPAYDIQILNLNMISIKKRLFLQYSWPDTKFDIQPDNVLDIRPDTKHTDAEYLDKTNFGVANFFLTIDT